MAERPIARISVSFTFVSRKGLPWLLLHLLVSKARRSRELPQCRSWHREAEYKVVTEMKVENDVPSSDKQPSTSNDLDETLIEAPAPE